MSVAYQNPQVREHSKVAELPRHSPIVPMKLGEYGPQGSGKSTTAAMLAASLSAQFHNRAPVYVVDPEAAWSYLKPVIFDVEGIELIQRPYRSFKDMAASFREAEKLGCCVWVVDPLTLLWNELMESFRLKNNGFIPIDKWGDIRSMWQDYVRHFLNSPMHAIACGRLGNDFEEVEDDRKAGKTKLVKVGTKFKAGGGESFGYEPHLLLEMSLERKAKKVQGQEREGEGRMVHRADVLKDRTWALNGKIFRWSDKPRYEKGSYRQVWESIQPHFQRVQQTMALVKIDSGSTTDLISDDGDGEFYRARQRREAMCAEIKACMDMFFAGRGKEDIQVRLAVTDLLFGVKSREAADQLHIEKLEHGLRILQAYEKRVDRDLSSPATILNQIGECIREYDTGNSEGWESPLPF